ncbi:DUF4232 domain-containing protein [Streptomyces sp. NPDC059255]|uniref:DUF4232 domain-containing protein n=1 Tax=Streptomyces sp. NPDC059255 TaxID=3346793 RepID=UPI00368AE845
MSRIRNSRTRLVTVAASVALAAFSLTACQDGTGLADEGASKDSAATAPADESANASKESASGSSDGSSSGGSSSANGSSGSGSSGSGSSGGDAKQNTGGSQPNAEAPDQKDSASSGKTVTCEGSVTKTVATPLSRPLNHLLLTVTNTGSNTCFLYGYPAVQFGEAQSVPPVIEDTQPQAVVTLEPGQSGYAAVSLSAGDGSGADGSTEKSLGVYFQGRSGNASVGKGANPPLPSKGVHIDNSLKVTYWQSTMDLAINW